MAPAGYLHPVLNGAAGYPHPCTSLIAGTAITSHLARLGQGQGQEQCQEQGQEQCQDSARTVPELALRI